MPLLALASPNRRYVGKLALIWVRVQHRGPGVLRGALLGDEHCTSSYYLL